MDAWGLVDEETDASWKVAAASTVANMPDPATTSRRWLALERYEPYRDKWRTYTQELGWFFQHGVPVLVTNPVLGKQAATEENRQMVRQQAEKLELYPDTAPRQSTFHLIEATKHLPPFQREFRHLFRDLVPTAVLQTLESREQKLLDETLALWRWLAFAPHIVNQQPGYSSQQRIEEAITKYQKHIRQDLLELSSGSLKLAFQTNITWKQEPVLCIVLDTSQALQQFQMLQPVLEVIHRVLRSANNADLMRHVLTRKWESLVVVPLFTGKSVSGTAWRIGMSVFLNYDFLTEIKWWNLAQHALPEDTCKALTITQWDQPDIHHAMQLGEEVSKLRLVVAHLHDIQQLPDLDAEGIEIAQLYIREYQSIFSQQLQATINALAWMVEFVGREVKQPHQDQQTLATISEGIKELVTDILPTPDFSQETNIQLASMESWLKHLEAALVKALVVQSLALNIINSNC